jgi:hypothetical protein
MRTIKHVSHVYIYIWLQDNSSLIKRLREIHRVLDRSPDRFDFLEAMFDSFEGIGFPSIANRCAALSVLVDLHHKVEHKVVNCMQDIDFLYECSERLSDGCVQL